MEQVLIINKPDFRRYATQKSNRTDGRIEYYSVCEELIGGRWEGFVSIKNERQYREDKDKIKVLNC